MHDLQIHPRPYHADRDAAQAERRHQPVKLFNTPATIPTPMPVYSA